MTYDRTSVTIGERTEFGEVAAIGFRDGERYFLAVNEYDEVALIPLLTRP